MFVICLAESQIRYTVANNSRILIHIIMKIVYLQLISYNNYIKKVIPFLLLYLLIKALFLGNS